MEIQNPIHRCSSCCKIPSIIYSCIFENDVLSFLDGYKRGGLYAGAENARIF